MATLTLPFATDAAAPAHPTGAAWRRLLRRSVRRAWLRATLANRDARMLEDIGIGRSSGCDWLGQLNRLH